MGKWKRYALDVLEPEHDDARADLAEARAEIVAIEQKLGVDRDRANRAEAEIARLEKELAECREERSKAEERCRIYGKRATEAERERDEVRMTSDAERWRDTAFKVAEDRDRYELALERIAKKVEPFSHPHPREIRDIARAALNAPAEDGQDVKKPLDTEAFRNRRLSEERHKKG